MSTLRVERAGAGASEVELPEGGGEVVVDGVEAHVDLSDRGLVWSVANVGKEPVPLESVGVSWRLGTARGAVRVFWHGWQSWSRARLAVLGEDEDPSRNAHSLDIARSMYQCDKRPAPSGWLRSELVTVVALGGPGPLTCLGFDAATSHDGTFWLHREGDDVTVRAEAYLGGAVLRPGERRELHSVSITSGASAGELLEEWAGRLGTECAARTSASYQVGWCSWYHYFHGVTEEAFRANLALAGDWPFDVFQLDDGYQAAVGDWTATNDRFPSGLESLAARVSAAGLRPGIWLAPFFVTPDSAAYAAHPDWAPRMRGVDAPLPGHFNPGWGGLTYVLDTTRDEVLEHVAGVARDLVGAGFTYLKLDFTYGPAVPGEYADPTRTPAERVRAGYEAVRLGAGDDAFLLGCGAPLGPTVGLVDGMRIGADVAPAWGAELYAPGYDEEGPATRNAWCNTLTRSFMHRKLWLNDPDCLMLRDAETSMSPEAVRAWALAVGVSGGMALVSDDLALLSASARTLLDEVVALGRESDAAAVSGHPARCEDLLDRRLPARLRAGRLRLDADPELPTAGVVTG